MQKSETKLFFQDSEIKKFETQVQTLKDLINTVPDKRFLQQLETKVNYLNNRVKKLEDNLNKLENMEGEHSGGAKRTQNIPMPGSKN